MEEGDLATLTRSAPQLSRWQCPSSVVSWQSNSLDFSIICDNDDLDLVNLVAPSAPVNHLQFVGLSSGSSSVSF